MLRHILYKHQRESHHRDEVSNTHDDDALTSCIILCRTADSGTPAFSMILYLLRCIGIVTSAAGAADVTIFEGVSDDDDDDEDAAAPATAEDGDDLPSTSI